jgi:AraC family transcriptional regulator
MQSVGSALTQMPILSETIRKRIFNSSLSNETSDVGKGCSASVQIGLILDNPPLLVPDDLGDGTRLTQRWKHGAIHDRLASMLDHVIMTYYGDTGDHEIVMSAGAGDRQNIASRTRSGTITVIPSGHEARWDIAGSIEVSHIYLSQARFQKCADILAKGKRVELLDRVGFEDPAAARIMELLSAEAKIDEPSARLFVEQAIDLLCIQLLRKHTALSIPVTQPPAGLAPWQVKRVTAYMLERASEPLTLDELAGVIHLSRFHFCTAFRLATGKTPHEWLVIQRIDMAKKLLEDRVLNITEVGLAVGYGTPSAFTAAFRKIVGCTPTDFRRRL